MPLSSYARCVLLLLQLVPRAMLPGVHPSPLFDGWIEEPQCVLSANLWNLSKNDFLFSIGNLSLSSFHHSGYTIPVLLLLKVVFSKTSKCRMKHSPSTRPLNPVTARPGLDELLSLPWKCGGGDAPPGAKRRHYAKGVWARLGIGMASGGCHFFTWSSHTAVGDGVSKEKLPGLHCCTPCP